MGLFSNKKNPCILCGEATPRIFAREACGGKLCSDCGKKISMQEEILQGISLEELKQHMKYRELLKLFSSINPFLLLELTFE